MLTKIQNIIAGATTYNTAYASRVEFRNSPKFGDEVTALEKPLIVEEYRRDYTKAVVYVIEDDIGDIVLYKPNIQGKYYELVKEVFQDNYNRDTDFITAVIIAIDRYLQEVTK